MKPIWALIIANLLCGSALADNLFQSDAPPLSRTPGWEPRNQISYIDPRPGDTLYPVNVNNSWGYMNQQGQLVVFPRFDWTDDFYDGLARAVIDGKTGYLKGNGEWVHEPRYVYAERFAEGRAVIGDGNRYGYIEKSGKPLTPIEFDGALRFAEGLAGVMKDGLGGFINVSGELEIPMRFTQVRSFREGYASVVWLDAASGERVRGYIDRRGQEAFADPRGQIEMLGDFHDGLARVKGHGQWGYLGRNWKLRIPVQFDDAREFVNGLAAVRVGPKWGYIDKAGQMVIEPMFDDADDMDSPLAMVIVDGLVGYVNRVDNQGIAPRFTGGRPFFRDYARVDLEPSFAYLDRVGRAVWDPRQAVQGFINKRTLEDVAILRYRSVNHHRTIEPPAYREPLGEPYPPEYRYDPVLPQPAH